jgi:hypothetical protein
MLVLLHGEEMTERMKTMMRQIQIPGLLMVITHINHLAHDHRSIDVRRDKIRMTWKWTNSNKKGRKKRVMKTKTIVKFRLRHMYPAAPPLFLSTHIPLHLVSVDPGKVRGKVESQGGVIREGRVRR